MFSFFGDKNEEKKIRSIQPESPRTVTIKLADIEYAYKEFSRLDGNANALKRRCDNLTDTIHTVEEMLEKLKELKIPLEKRISEIDNIPKKDIIVVFPSPVGDKECPEVCYELRIFKVPLDLFETQQNNGEEISYLKLQQFRLEHTFSGHFSKKEEVIEKINGLITKDTFLLDKAGIYIEPVSKILPA